VLIEDTIAVFTDQKWGASLDRKEGYEKQAHIVIYPFLVDPHMTADRAGSRLLID